jgi:hypothetical protein
MIFLFLHCILRKTLIRMKKNLLFLGGFLLIFFTARADNWFFQSDCSPASAKIDLDINNVRATLLNAGDLWWNLSNAGYEIPKGSGQTSAFCGALWIGGLDQGNNLHAACMTYRQTGNDFWPGPLDTISAQTHDSICRKYDRFWKLNRSEVEQFLAHRTDTGYTIPEAILSWPGNGNTTIGQANYLAPFIDSDGDGIYNPNLGDYPAFALNGQQNCNYHLLGDQAIWWVFNDKGNQHTETGGNAFGLEIQAMAFAFRSNDEINNATFYRYQLINRSVNSYHEMWFGQWIDNDLGAYDDDYVACDVMRGMGYVYNGDAMDGLTQRPDEFYPSYGANPPAMGVDFLQGPFADDFDLIDNDRDSLLDEAGERIKMSAFKTYDGNFTITGNPEFAEQFYYFLQGKWKDGTPQVYGGNGCCSGLPSNFMFPGDSDPYGWATGGIPQPSWSEQTVGNVPFDRRYVMSVGPFSMHPGEVETITIGLPWARDSFAGSNNLAAIDKLKIADDKLQQFFDNCFALPCVNAPAPDFNYSLNDNTVYFTAEVVDGIYQWDFGDQTFSSNKHPSHTFSQTGDYQVCLRVITPCDTMQVCKTIHAVKYEHECGPAVQRLDGMGSGWEALDYLPVSVEAMLNSADQVVWQPWYKPLHAPVRVTYEDYDLLVNGDYRVAVDTALGITRWKAWRVGETDTVYSDPSLAPDVKQFIPQWGIAIKANQVEQPGLSRNTRKNGFVSAHMEFENSNQNWLTGVADEDQNSSFNWIRSGTYQSSGSGTCDAKYNDSKVGASFIDPNSDYENLIGRTWAPYRLVSYDPVETEICYSAGVAYYNGNSATMASNKIENLASVNIVITSDRSKWSRCPVFETGVNTQQNEGGRKPLFLRDHLSVDKDGRTIWQGGLSDPTNPEAADYIAADGMGWFPGYAYNLETGERLNIGFGENSSLVAENGRDMLWNPSENLKTQFHEPLMGGMHFVYVFGHNGDAYGTSGCLNGVLKDVPRYDAGKAIYDILSRAWNANDIPAGGEAFRDAIWAGTPMLNNGHTLFETDVTIHLCVGKPFRKYVTSSVQENNSNPLFGFSIDKENLGCNLYEGAVNAYPNPFDESCTILFDNHHNDPFTFELFDMRGRMVRREENVLSDRVIVYREALEEGVYIFKLTAAGKKPFTGRIVLR